MLYIPEEDLKYHVPGLNDNLHFLNASSQTVDLHILLSLKNSGHLWLACTELQGGFNMLQLISINSVVVTLSFKAKTVLANFKCNLTD